MCLHNLEYKTMMNTTHFPTGAELRCGEPEIFSDDIKSPVKEQKQKSLSKMKKPELYELCKKLVEENKKLQLFNNSSDELLQTHMKNEKKLLEDLKWKDNDLYYATKQRNSDKMFIEHQLKLKKELQNDKKELEDTLKLKEEEVGMLVYENSDLKKENNKLKSFLSKVRETFTE